MQLKGGRVMDDRGIRLEEEGCQMIGEIKWIPYHDTIAHVIVVSIVILLSTFNNNDKC